VAFLAMKKLMILLDKEQLCHYSAQSQLLECLGVLQEMQLRTGLSVNTVLPGKIYQVINMASFLLVGRIQKELRICLN
jgi:hypothetical protein